MSAFLIFSRRIWRSGNCLATSRGKNSAPVFAILVIGAPWLHSETTIQGMTDSVPDSKTVNSGKIVAVTSFHVQGTLLPHRMKFRLRSMRLSCSTPPGPPPAQLRILLPWKPGWCRTAASHRRKSKA